MPLGTLDGTPPPFFRQGPSALSKLIFFSALALFLMVADARFRCHPAFAGRGRHCALPGAVGGAAARDLGAGRQPVFRSRSSRSQAKEASAQYQLGLQSQRAQQVEQLTLENTRLRALLELRARINTPALAAQVLYDAADPYTRKVIIDKGLLDAVSAGSPVLDETRRAGPGHPGLPVGERSHPGHRPRSGHSRAQHAHRCARRWLLATPPCAVARWSCASWLPTSTCRRATC